MKSNKKIDVIRPFYAVISERDGSHLLVDGLEINDINSRGQFYLTIDDDPAGIDEVLRVQLLEDVL